MRKHICILSLAMPIENDPRTGRQIDALLPDHDLTIIGFGAPPDSVTWKPVGMATPAWRRLWEMTLIAIGRIAPRAYDLYFWSRPRYAEAFRHALDARADAYHASDWAMLPIAVRAARAHGAKVVYDIDEYWARFGESSRLWSLFFAPLTRHLEGRAIPGVDRAMTVSPAFVDRYQAEHGLDSILVYNAPPSQAVSHHPTDGAHIRLIHHGAAQADRRLETLVEALALLDDRFTLHFLLGNANPPYLDLLRTLGERLAPGRVFFRDMVPYDRVVESIADCDIELCYMAPTTYTWLYTLPNKLFEAMHAGLAVLVAPSPAMAAVVRETDCGWVADGFSAPDLADVLRPLTAEAIEQKRAHARAASLTIDAASEMAKVRALYADLFRR